MHVCCFFLCQSLISTEFVWRCARVCLAVPFARAHLFALFIHRDNFRVLWIFLDFYPKETKKSWKWQTHTQYSINDHQWRTTNSIVPFIKGFASSSSSSSTKWFGVFIFQIFSPFRKFIKQQKQQCEQKNRRKTNIGRWKICAAEKEIAYFTACSSPDLIISIL